MQIVEKAIRIDENLELFLNEHNEIQIQKDEVFNLYYITIPDNYILNYLLISPNNNFLHLICTDDEGNLIKFPPNF